MVLLNSVCLYRVYRWLDNTPSLPIHVINSLLFISNIRTYVGEVEEQKTQDDDIQPPKKRRRCCFVSICACLK